MSIKRTYTPLKKIRLNIDRRTLLPKERPTDKQLELFSLMYLYYCKYNEPISLRKASEFLGIKHLPVYDRMRGLVRLGYVYKTGFSNSYIPSAGAIVLVKEGIIQLNTFEV